MNANELADALWYFPSIDSHLIEESIAMLRKQQAEIEALNHQVVIWEKATMQARIKSSLQQVEIDYWKQSFEKAMELLTPKTKPPETHVDLVDWVKELIAKEKV